MQVEANRVFDDFDVHSDALGLREAFDLLPRFAATFAASCFTRSLTIRSIRAKGIGSLRGYFTTLTGHVA